MSFDWKKASNNAARTSKINNINNYLNKITLTNLSPIDNYYNHRTKAITTATPQLLTSAPWLSGYILASIISATELYFREIFSRTIFLCPHSKKLSSEKSIHMGAILWHGPEAFSRAAFEHLSFAGSDKIKACSKDFLGFEISKTSNTFAALEEFDKLCELRHGIVHSGLTLPGKNAIKLLAPKPQNEAVIIEFDIARLHEATAACTALIESYNAELYARIVERWAIDWRRYPDWTPTDELIKFKKICELFFSSSNSPSDRPSIVKLRNMIKRNFGI